MHVRHPGIPVHVGAYLGAVANDFGPEEKGKRNEDKKKIG
jgi:hypothetical protein